MHKKIQVDILTYKHIEKGTKDTHINAHTHTQKSISVYALDHTKKCMK